MMTVQQLMALLSAQPPDRRVLVNGYEGGYDDPEFSLETIFLDDRPGLSSSYWGRHDTSVLDSDVPTVKAECVILGR